MKQPSVSIIVPVYNVEPYVEDCIRSVMRQSYHGPTECIVVDDCGTDNSIAITEKLIAAYNGPISFSILHHTHNRGLSAARNTGMDVSTADYIYFLDSDDEITDDCIEKLMAFAISNDNIEIIQGNTRIIPEREPDKFFIKSENLILLTSKEVRHGFYRDRIIIHNAWNKLIKRSFVTQNNLSFKEGILYEDLLWTFYWLKYATTFGFVSDVLYHYRERQGSIITESNVDIIAKYDKIIYREILNNLTIGHEKEELTLFTKRFAFTYIYYNHPQYDDLLKSFWEKIRYYGFPSCYVFLIVALLSRRLKICRLLYLCIRYFKHYFSSCK